VHLFGSITGLCEEGLLAVGVILIPYHCLCVVGDMRPLTTEDNVGSPNEGRLHEVVRGRAANLRVMSRLRRQPGDPPGGLGLVQDP
jgi:hypothetical protein